MEDEVMARLQRRARRHGRTTDEEVREILRNAVKDEGARRIPLGRRLRERFAAIGLEDDLPELRGEVAQPALFGNKKRSGRRSVEGHNRSKV
jgi:plasmid stability protein